jgi:two-component system CheB/CheR fusion protein
MSPKEIEVRDGSGRWYSLRLRPYRTLDNRIDGAVLLLVDIDTVKRHEALQREQEVMRRQHDMLDRSQEAILIFGLGSGVISYWNHGAEETYGYARDEALGQVASQLLHSSPNPRVYLRELEEVGYWTGELQHRRRDGRPVRIESRMVRVADATGQPVVIETNRDITGRKQVEADLRKRATELELVDEKRSEFLALLAHELRNPLAALSNSAELLKHLDSDPALLERTHELIGRQVHKMARLINELLDVARVTRDHIDLNREPLDLVLFARRAVETAVRRFGPRQQDVTMASPSEPVLVTADAVRLEQILDNILDNACKFTPPGGHIELGVEVDGPNARVRVRDDGIGIEADMLTRIFELFVRADASPSRPTEGLGIGLALVHRLVELHGGRVEMRSEGLGHGSEFIMSLPLADPAARATKPMPSKAPARPALSRRVLVVDDNGDAADSLGTLLRRAGHDVKVVRDPRLAVDLALEFRPDVALLDIGMPGIDGYELARQLRERLDGRSLHLIALTGYSGHADQQRALQAGFDEHLTKPAPLGTILDFIAAAASAP